MGTLSTMQTPIFDITHLLGVTAGKHLVDEASIIRAIVPWMNACKSVPVIGKDLFEDAPGWRGCCSHQSAPSWGVGMLAMPLFYHISPAQSTLSSTISE